MWFDQATLNIKISGNKLNKNNCVELCKIFKSFFYSVLVEVLQFLILTCKQYALIRKKPTTNFQ